MQLPSSYGCLLARACAKNRMSQPTGDYLLKKKQNTVRKVRIRPENTDQHTRGMKALYVPTCTNSSPVGNKNVIINCVPTESNLTPLCFCDTEWKKSLKTDNNSAIVLENSNRNNRQSLIQWNPDFSNPRFPELPDISNQILFPLDLLDSSSTISPPISRTLDFSKLPIIRTNFGSRGTN